MAGFGYACAVVLAAVFVRAGVAKAVRPAETTAGFVALGVPAAALTARVVPALELLLALVLLALPRAGAIVAMVLLVTFTGFLARSLRAGLSAGCNCFGQASVRPLSGVDLLRNSLLVLTAAAALLAEEPVVPGPRAVALVLGGVAAGVAGLRWARARPSRRPGLH